MCFESYNDRLFQTKMKKLTEILNLTSYAVNETQNLQQKFIDAEVEYMNNINNKLHRASLPQGVLPSHKNV